MWWLGLALAAPLIEEVQAPSLRWETVRSEHFVVHYSVDRRSGEGDRLAAERVLAEGEALWLPMCAEVEYFPVERVHVLLLPEDGINGWTWPSWDWIVLSDHPGGVLERLRGPMDPLRLVLRHELGHFLHLKKAKRMVEPVEGVELTVSLRHGPSNVATEAALEWSTLGPHWWSEGSAEGVGVSAGLGQVSAEQRHTVSAAADGDRLLQDAWFTRYVKDDWGDSERSYQQGLAFVRWLEDTYALDIAELADEVARRGGVRPALRALTGLSERQLRADFQVGVGGGTVPAGATRPGRWELWPQGREGRVAYHGGGYLLVESREPESVAGLGGEAVWGPRLVVPISYGSRYSMVDDVAVVVGRDALRTGLDVSVLDRGELFLVDLSGDWLPEADAVRDRARALPDTVHGMDPVLSPDGRELAWVRAVDGGGTLMRGPVEGPYTEVAGGPGEWWRTPVFLPDGRLLAVHRIGDQAEIAEVSEGRVVHWTASAASEADLAVTPTGEVLFTADYAGAREVYQLTPATGRIERLTDERGVLHTPSMTPAGDLLVARPTAEGVALAGVPAADLLHEEVTGRFHDMPFTAVPLAVPGYEVLSRPGFSPVAITPFVAVTMGAADDVDLGAGLAFATHAYDDGREVHGAFWLGEEAGGSLGARRRLGPLQLTVDGGHQLWERPTPRRKLEGWRSWGGAELTLERGVMAGTLGAHAAEIGIREAGKLGLVAGTAELRAHDARRVDLAIEGYDFAVGAELGREGQAYAQGWMHLDVEARAPSSIRGAWRHHHAVLAGLDLLASTSVHPWLMPRAGGLGDQALLGRTVALPGYPELAIAADALVVARLGYRVPLARWRRMVGPYFAEGATFEVDGHLGAAGGALPADVGGRLVLRGTVRDARWDLAVRLAQPLSTVSVGDIDGDDVFDALPGAPRERTELMRPRLIFELGRVK
ncbi:MAG: hypothetical protein EP330_19080 [Deltaproteobacteria bacterium]|nr:MAG: hypothetical protein EP330_19080 [Deltaproteobacteria bacterium]